MVILEIDLRSETSHSFDSVTFKFGIGIGEKSIIVIPKSFHMVQLAKLT